MHYKWSFSETVSQPKENSTCVMPGEAALVCAVEEGDSVYFHWNEVPSKNTNDQETVLIDLICTVAVEKRSRSGKKHYMYAVWKI